MCQVTAEHFTCIISFNLHSKPEETKAQCSLVNSFRALGLMSGWSLNSANDPRDSVLISSQPPGRVMSIMTGEVQVPWCTLEAPYML